MEERTFVTLDEISLKEMQSYALNESLDQTYVVPCLGINKRQSIVHGMVHTCYY